MIEKPVALVTGGATGIGAACCRALAAEGFHVGIHYRKSDRKAQTLAGGNKRRLFNSGGSGEHRTNGRDDRKTKGYCRPRGCFGQQCRTVDQRRYFFDESGTV